jgi:hypothetical protein
MNTSNLKSVEDSSIVEIRDSDSYRAQLTPLESSTENRLSQAEVDDLLAELDKQAKNRRRRRRNYIIFIACITIFVITLSIVGVVTNHQESFKALRLLSFISVFAGMAAASKVHKESVRKLAKNPDIRGVGHFIDALEFGDKEIKAEASESLQVLLPLLKASDNYLLTTEHRNLLYKQLKGNDSKLILATLTSLEQIGDEKATHIVEWLAANPGMGGRSMEIAAKANEVLPSLRVRAEQEKAAHTLLRPTVTEEGDSALLLRPAGSTDSSEHLLRPAEINGDPLNATTTANSTFTA